MQNSTLLSFINLMCHYKAAVLLLLFWRGSPAVALWCGYCVVFCFGAAAVLFEWRQLFSRSDCLGVEAGVSDDKLIWKAEKDGEYYVKSVYRLCMEGLVDTSHL
ncbi:transmembrane protein, putative [Medicago truncatula]|uniref:Transmembrane protein, putative n=1 Tax=Medicago truncatula TaxID=3880 RepID=A0A072U2D3_MEDTR|nr:transmembrane protein, putative [Medicago truncatula]